MSVETSRIQLLAEPPVTLHLTQAVETKENAWTQTTVWAPYGEGGGSLQARAIVYQSPDSGADIRFLEAKAGVFGIVDAAGVRFILLPGSELTIPSEVDLVMPGAWIEAKTPQGAVLATQRERAAQTVTDQAMILGAGLASRFVPVSGPWTGYPKPAVPLIGEDSVIVCLAKHLRRHGIRRLIVNTYYMPDVIKAQLSRLEGLECVFVDEAEPSGTAGGLVKALDAGLVDLERPILIMQGDAVTDADLSTLIETHARQQPWVTLGTKRIHDDEVSMMAVVETDHSGPDGQSGHVLSYKEKPTLAEAGDSRLGSIGFYVLSPEALALFSERGHEHWCGDAEFDYAHHYFPSLLSQWRQLGDGQPASQSPIYACMIPQPFYWSDIGRPEQYIATVREICQGQVGLDLPPEPDASCLDGIIYWPGAAEAVQNSGIIAQGNVIALLAPNTERTLH